MKEIAANIEPAFISKGAASYIASTYNAGPGTGQAPTLTLDDVCLDTCNSFLDYLLAMIIRDARSTSLQTLKGSLARVLDSALGYVALNEAQAELETYRNQENGQGRQFPTEETTEAPRSANFDVEGVWSQARIRCMIYSTIGEKEESDFPVIEDDESSVTPPVAIFLTAVLEFLGEHILVTAARFARNRLGANVSGSLTTSDLDRGTRLDKVLGSIWQGYLQLLPDSEFLTAQTNSSEARTPAPALAKTDAVRSPALPQVSSQPTSNAPPQMVPLASTAATKVTQPTTSKAVDEVAPPLAHDTQPVVVATSPATTSTTGNATQTAAEIQKATMWSKQEHVKAAQLRGVENFKQTPPASPLQQGDADAFASTTEAQTPAAQAQQASPQVGSGTVTPRKGVTTGIRSPKLGTGAFAVSNNTTSNSNDNMGLGLSMPPSLNAAAEPDSDYGRFLHSEKLRFAEASQDAQAIEAQRMRVIAQREDVILQQQQTARSKTDGRSGSQHQQQVHQSPPSDLFVEAPKPKGLSLEPREPRVGPSYTARLAVFLRNTGPPDSDGRPATDEAAVRAAHLTKSPIRAPIEESTDGEKEEDDEDAALFEGVRTSGKRKTDPARRESLAEFLKNVPPPASNGAILPDPLPVTSKGPVLLGQPIKDEDNLVAGPAYADLPAGARQVQVGTTASDANAAESARKEQQATLEMPQSPTRKASGPGLLRMLSPSTPDRSQSRMAVTSPRSPTAATQSPSVLRPIPLVSPFLPTSSFKSASSVPGDKPGDEDEEDEFYDDDSLYGLPRRKQPQLESLADFLRNVPPPASSSASPEATSPRSKRKSGVARRISSLWSGGKKQDGSTDEAGGPASPTTPTRPNHRPLITSGNAPQL